MRLIRLWQECPYGDDEVPPLREQAVIALITIIGYLALSADWPGWLFGS